MINPMGWTYLTYPFTENNWVFIIISIIFNFIFLITAFALEGRRDMGAGYLSEKEGRANAKKSLLSIHGLFINLNKGLIISWLIGFIIMGAAYGSIYGDMQTFIEGNEIVKQMFVISGVSIEESFTGTIMMVMIVLVTILPLVIINKLFSEESRLHLSQLYSTKVKRSQYYWTNIILAITACTFGIFLASVSLGGTAFSVMDDNTVMKIGDFILAGFNFLPAVLIYTGLAALILGWAPRIGKIIYAYLGYSFALNYFGGLIDLPKWFSNTAVLSWVPRMPVDSFNGLIFFVMIIISVILFFIGYIGYSKRDFVEGA